jgi:tRNA pseudouridine55 synthase
MNSGFLLLDKPSGFTSFDLIRDLRKKSGLRKIGHTGTLDPFATGLSILCLGKTTRLSSFLLGQNKVYQAEIELGRKTDTGDVTGEMIAEKEIPSLSSETVSHAAREMLNLRLQLPPRYSAVKVSGKPAYKMARKGESFSLQEKNIRIYSFEISAIVDNIISYRAEVSKGTYIRTLSETFAETLGTVAYTRALRRLAIGRLSVSEAVPPAEITSENWQSHLKPISSVLGDYPHLLLNPEECESFLHGRRIVRDKEETEGEFLVYGVAGDIKKDNPECLGWGILRDRVLSPKIVLV